MGMFDTFLSEDGSVAVQTKVGPNLMHEYKVGDSVQEEFSDAIIVGYEGAVVIHNGRVVSVTAGFPTDAPAGLPCITKWGGAFNPETEKIDEHHPFASVLRTMRKCQPV